MSHITIIIRRAPATTTDEIEPSYEYAIPVQHDATPAQVAELVRKAYRRLEGADSDH